MDPQSNPHMIQSTLTAMVPRWWRHMGILLTMMLIVTACAGTPASNPAGPRTLAVWNLENLSLPGTTQPDIGALLTARVMETAGSMDTYALVEREQLLAILQELNLGSSQLADEATSLRVGRLAGARMMLFGSYQVVAAQMRIDLRLVDVETGRVSNTAEQVVPAENLTQWLAGAELATREVLK